MGRGDRSRGRPRRVVGLLCASAVAVLAVVRPYANPPRGESAVADASLEWSFVTRVDLDTTVVAGGDLQAVKETVVSCEAEDLADADGFLIVSLIANGAPVKKGDVLCRLDSSQLEEIARLEEIQVNQDRSSYTQARLAVEIARSALREYQEGQILVSIKEYEGKIALARSDLKRQEDRLGWTETMYGKGYVSKGQMLTDRQTLEKTRHELRKTEGELDVFRRYQAPKEVAALASEIAMAENHLGVEIDRLKAAEAKQKADAEAAALKLAETTEAALKLSPVDRQRLQVALTSLGFDTQGSDGVFGPRSREMILNWQRARSQSPTTGYLTAAQQQALLGEAAPAVAKFDDDQKKAEAAAKARAATNTAPTTSTTSTAPTTSPRTSNSYGISCQDPSGRRIDYPGESSCPFGFRPVR